MNKVILILDKFLWKYDPAPEKTTIKNLNLILVKVLSNLPNIIPLQKILYLLKPLIYKDSLFIDKKDRCIP